MNKFDLCVIGGGPSGYAAAMRALDFGKKVALIEKDKIGGAGIFNGALSSKTLWEISMDYQATINKNRGYEVKDVKLNYPTVIKVMNEAVNERKEQLEHQLNILSKSSDFTFIKGFGKLVSQYEILVKSKKGDETIWAENIVLAVGSRPRKLSHIPIDERIIATSDGLTSFPDFPKSIVILGAGVIGCEFATIFSNFGKTKVYLIDKAERILPFEDEDVANVIASNLEKNGVVLHKGSSLEKMDIIDGQVEYVLNYKGGKKETLRVEKALCAVGRVPNIEGLGLKELGVNLKDSGHVVDDFTQTNIPNIYAVGDLTADIALVNVGELEGRYAVETIYGKPYKKLTYENISTIMFLNPETAGVGLNETQAQKQKIPYRIARMHYSYVNRAIAMRKTQGFIKILVTDDDEMRILGMRALGPHASSTIQAVALLISMNKGIRELAELIHPHPSITEGVQECVRMLLGKSMIKPHVFKEKLKCHRVTADGQYIEI